MGWFILFLVLASQDIGPSRSAPPPPDPMMQMWVGLGIGLALSIVLAPVLEPIAYRAGQRAGDAVCDWWMSLRRDARAKGGVRGVAYSVRIHSRSPGAAQALRWLYDNPDGATFVWQSGVMVANQGPADYATLRAIGRSGYVIQCGHRPELFSKANSASVEHHVVFTLADHARRGIWWERETHPAVKAAAHIEAHMFDALAQGSWRGKARD